MEKIFTCCFTGHRPAKLGFDENDSFGVDLKNRIAGSVMKLIEVHGVRSFISGMALGVDITAAEAVLKLREIYPEITLECALPCEDQSLRWRTENRKRYDRILARADKVTVLQKKYSPMCMRLRDEYMVDNSDYVLAVWNGSPGGTAYTVRYARRKEKTIIILPPVSKE